MVIQSAMQKECHMNVLKQKKVCYISHSIYPGPNFEYLSKLVAKKGYDVSLILLHESEKKKYEVVDGRTIYRIPSADQLIAELGRRYLLLFIKKAVDD
jgi:hypothetical protein